MLISTIKRIGFIGISFFVLCGFGDKHSSLTTQATAEGQNLSVQFVVKPDSGMKLTKEGPWSLTVTNPQGIKLPLDQNAKFVIKDFDEKLSGFLLKGELVDSKTPVRFTYQVKAFVCSEDKKHCYPQVHKGEFAWTKS